MSDLVASLPPSSPPALPAEARPVGGDPGLQPSPFLIRHSGTFVSRLTTPAKTYWYQRDEALRQSPDDARVMRRDGWIRRLLRERMEPVALAKWHLEAENPGHPRQAAGAQLVTKLIERIPRFTRFRMKLRECNWYGVYAVQTVVGREVIDGRPRRNVTNWLPVHGDKIVFRHDGTPGILVNASDKPEYLRQGATILPTERGYALFLDKPAWRQRFVIDTFDIEDADYYEPDLAGGISGSGLRGELQWIWWLRADVLAQMMDFIGRVGAGGITVIRYEEGNDASFRKAQDVAKGLESGNVILAPEPRGTSKETNKVERIEANTAGAQFIVDLVTNWFDGKIERIIIGQTASSRSETSGLGTHNTDLQSDTKYQILKSDAANLDETLTTDLVLPLLRYNDPGADFRLKFVTDLSEPGNDAKLEAVSKAYAMGVSYGEDDIRSLTGLPKPQPGDKTLSKQQEQLAGMLGGMDGPGGVPPPGGGEQSGEHLPGEMSGEIDDSDAGGVNTSVNTDPADAQPSPALHKLFAAAVESGRLFTPEGLAELRAALDGGGVKLQYAREKAKWTPYTHPETGQRGWKSAGGRVVYEDPGSSPDDHPHGRKAGEGEGAGASPTPAADPGDKVRRHAGVERGKAGDLPRLQTQIGAMLDDPRQVTPANMRNLVNALSGLTAKELAELGRQFGQKRGRKGAMVEGIGGALQGQGLPAPGELKRVDIDATPEVDAATRERDLADAHAATHRDADMADAYAQAAIPDATRDPTALETAAGGVDPQQKWHDVRDHGSEGRFPGGVEPRQVRPVGGAVMPNGAKGKGKPAPKPAAPAPAKPPLESPEATLARLGLKPMTPEQSAALTAPKAKPAAAPKSRQQQLQARADTLRRQLAGHTGNDEWAADARRVDEGELQAVEGELAKGAAVKAPGPAAGVAGGGATEATEQAGKSRFDTAHQIAEMLSAGDVGATPRVWASGDAVRVYLNDPKSRLKSHGQIDILPDGTVELDKGATFFLRYFKDVRAKIAALKAKPGEAGGRTKFDTADRRTGTPDDPMERMAAAAGADEPEEPIPSAAAGRRRTVRTVERDAAGLIMRVIETEE